MRLGRVEVVDGEPCQIVTFVLPATGLQEPSWFAWWVGTESGHVRQMAMVARAHYMVRSYRDFDAPIAIVPPADAGLPARPSRAQRPEGDEGTGNSIPWVGKMVPAHRLLP